jgi:hypothetical protein
VAFEAQLKDDANEPFGKYVMHSASSNRSMQARAKPTDFKGGKRIAVSASKSMINFPISW